MSTQLPKEEKVTMEELVVSQSYEIAALVNVLEKKGILTKAEILDEIKVIHNHLGSLEDL